MGVKSVHIVQSDGDRTEVKRFGKIPTFLTAIAQKKKNWILAVLFATIHTLTTLTAQKLKAYTQKISTITAPEWKHSKNRLTTNYPITIWVKKFRCVARNENDAFQSRAAKNKTISTFNRRTLNWKRWNEKVKWSTIGMSDALGCISFCGLTRFMLLLFFFLVRTFSIRATASAWNRN